MPRNRDYVMRRQDQSSRMGGDYAMNDGRNPRGSRGGYVTSRKPRRSDRSYNQDYNMMYQGDYNYYNDNRGRGNSGRGYDQMPYDSRMYDNRNYDQHMPYGFYGMGGVYPQNMDYGYDYGYYDMNKDPEKEYCEDLEEWIEKLEQKDKFRLGKQQTIEKARTMGVEFKDYDELEFYAAYLAMVSDFKSLHNILKDPAYYIHMAKDFLEDDDVKAKGGEKLCKYLDNIVM